MSIPEVRVAKSGEARVAFRSAGHGPPLVLLHGFLCDSRVWRTQFDGLADRFTVIAWDAPGAGVVARSTRAVHDRGLG